MNSERLSLRPIYSLALPLLIPLQILMGCSSTSPPRVSVGNAHVVHSTTDGTKGTFELFAENPNRDPLLLRDILYVVEVDGAKVFEGRRAAGATLAGFGGQTLTVPFVTTSANVLSPGAMIRISGDLEYSEASAIAKTLMEAGLSDPSESFKGEVNLSTEPAPLAEAPAAAPKAKEPAAEKPNADEPAKPAEK